MHRHNCQISFVKETYTDVYGIQGSLTQRWAFFLLQSVAVCCSLLQSVAGIGIQGSLTQRWVFFLLQSVVVCCSLLQSVAVCCSLLQSVAGIGIQGSLTQRWAFFRENIPLAHMYHILFSFEKNTCIIFFLTWIILFPLQKNYHSCTQIWVNSAPKPLRQQDAPGPVIPQPTSRKKKSTRQYWFFFFFGSQYFLILCERRHAKLWWGLCYE